MPAAFLFELGMHIEYHQCAFPFQIPHEFCYARFRRYLYTYMHMIHAHAPFQNLYLCLYSHSFLTISLISVFSSPYIIFRLYFGMKTIWYVQFHLVCDKLELSTLVALLCL